MKTAIYSAILAIAMLPNFAQAMPVAKTAAELTQSQVIVAGATFVWGGSSSWTCRGCGSDGLDP